MSRPAEINTTQVDDMGNPTHAGTLIVLNKFIMETMPNLDKERYFTDGMRYKEAKRQFYKKHGFGSYHPKFKDFFDDLFAEKGGDIDEKDDTVIIYSENKEGRRRFISEHKDFKAARRAMRKIEGDILAMEDTQGVGTMNRSEFERDYAEHDYMYADGGEILKRRERQGFNFEPVIYTLEKEKLDIPVYVSTDDGDYSSKYIYKVYAEAFGKKSYLGSTYNEEEAEELFNKRLRWHKSDAKFAGGGEVNGKYLDRISDAKKSNILKNIANHYGISEAEAEAEVRDVDAEMLYEYIANDQSLRMEVYNDVEINKYARGGDLWMQKAEKKMEKKGTVGLFTRKAKRRGLTTVEFANEVLDNPDDYPLKTRREAQFMKNANPQLFAKGGSVGEKKFQKVMHEWGEGKLKHGTTGKVVPKNRQDMAVAIAYSEAREVEPSFGVLEKGGSTYAGGGEIKKRSEKDSGRLYRAYLKVLDTDFSNKEYDKFQKLVKETQIPQDKLEKITHYTTTTPRGEQRYIDIYQYWGKDSSTYAGGGEIDSTLFNQLSKVDKGISFYEELGRQGERKKFVEILKKYDIETEGSPNKSDLKHLTIHDKAKLSNDLDKFGYNKWEKGGSTYAGGGKITESEMKEHIREYMGRVSFRKFGNLFRKHIDENFTQEMNEPLMGMTWSEKASYIIGDGDYKVTREQFESFANDARIEYSKGGDVDLFEYYEQQPAELRAVTEEWEERYMTGEVLDYKDTEEFLKKVEAVGYTFDYGLDNEAYGLRKKGVKLNELQGWEDAIMGKGGDVEITYRVEGQEKPVTLKELEELNKLDNVKRLTKDEMENLKFLKVGETATIHNLKVERIMAQGGEVQQVQEGITKDGHKVKVGDKVYFRDTGKTHPISAIIKLRDYRDKRKYDYHASFEGRGEPDRYTPLTMVFFSEKDNALTIMAQGGEVDEVISEGGRYVSIHATKDRMTIELTEEGKEEVKDLREDGKSDYEIMPDLFDDVQGNSELRWHNDLGDAGFALTSASGITDGYYYDDDGNFTDKGNQDSRVYYFADYALRSEIEDMMERGELVLNGADNKMAQGGEVDGKRYALTTRLEKYNWRVPIEDAKANVIRDIFLENKGRVDKKKWDYTIKNNAGWKKDWEDFKESMEVEVKDGKYVNPYQTHLFSKGGTIADKIVGGRISIPTLEGLLGRKAKYPRDVCQGLEFEKCFLSDNYRLLK